MSFIKWTDNTSLINHIWNLDSTYFPATSHLSLQLYLYNHRAIRANLYSVYLLQLLYDIWLRLSQGLIKLLIKVRPKYSISLHTKMTKNREEDGRPHQWGRRCQLHYLQICHTSGYINYGCLLMILRCIVLFDKLIFIDNNTKHSNILSDFVAISMLDDH